MSSRVCFVKSRLIMFLIGARIRLLDIGHNYKSHFPMFVAKASSFFASHVPIHFGKIYILMVRSTSLVVPARHRTPAPNFCNCWWLNPVLVELKIQFLVLNPKWCSKMSMCLRICHSYIVTVTTMYFCLFLNVFNTWIHHQQSTIVFRVPGTNSTSGSWIKTCQSNSEDGRWEGPWKDRDG